MLFLTYRKQGTQCPSDTLSRLCCGENEYFPKGNCFKFLHLQLSSFWDIHRTCVPINRIALDILDCKLGLLACAKSDFEVVKKLSEVSTFGVGSASG